MRIAVTAPTMIEALRRLGAVRRRRTLVLGEDVYRVRRGKLVRIPDRFARERSTGKRQKRWGRGENKDVERHRREKADRWALRLAMADWLYGWELRLCDWDDDYWDDQEYDCSWSDSGGSVTFLDLMR